MKMANKSSCTNMTFVCSEHPGIYYSYIYLFTSIVLIGITLNSFTFTIFLKESRQFRHFGFVLFLHHLSMSDLLFLFFISLQGICRCYDIKTATGHLACDIYMAYIFRPFYNTFYAVSVWITVTMTLERYTLIKQSKLFRNKFSTKVIHIIVACFYVFSFILHLPFFWYKELENGELVKTDISLTLGYEIWSWIRAVLAKYLPIILIIVINIAITTELWYARQRRISMMKQTNKFAKKPKFTKSAPLLLCVSTTFVVCNILEPIIYFDIYGPCKYHTYSYNVTVLVICILETCAASTNFIFYTAFNRRFRKVLCYILPVCGRNQIGPLSTMDQAGRQSTVVGDTIENSTKAIEFKNQSCDKAK